MNQLHLFMMDLLTHGHPQLDREQFDHEFHQKLQVYHEKVIAPMFRLAAMICLPLLVWSYLVTVLIEQQRYGLTLDVHYGRFALICTWSALVGLIVLCLRQCLIPFRRSFLTLEKKIRDDNYLIGKRLVNLTRRVTEPTG
jgi:hypothetical protein